MVSNIQYTSIQRVLDGLLDHPMLKDVTLEQAIRYAVRFMSLYGFPALYEDKIEKVEIDKFRGLLPCDLISIVQVRDCKSKIALRSMTNTFNPALLPQKEEECRRLDLPRGYAPEGMDRGPCHRHPHIGEGSFKTQGRMIYVSFPKGAVEIAYKAVKTDEDGYPMIVDNEVYIAALEAYIKKQVFTIKFDQGKISSGILQNAQQDYAMLAAELQDEFTVPSYSEAESISRMLNTMILQTRHFDTGFRDMGSREHLRRH